MAKNYANLYASVNDSSAIEQKFFIKLEVTRGTFVAPVGADFFLHTGGSINFTQPRSSSPHKTGRHHNNVIAEKTATEWSLEMLININTSAVQGTAELDPAVRVLWKSLLGRETTTAGCVYDSSNAPDITFTMLECGDKWAKQAVGAFCNNGSIGLPGDGRPTLSFDGMAKTMLLVGIGKSTNDNDTTNIISLDVPAEAKRFPVGAKVMIIEANGTTRSADTADGSPRTVTASNSTTGDVTLDGAVLADSDGSTTPIYLAYYEPATPVAIDNPMTGLVGDLTIDNMPLRNCMRSATVNLANNHEVMNYCYGEEGLSGVLFSPTERFTCGLDMEINVNDEFIEYFNNNKSTAEADQIEIILGDSAGRHFRLDFPKVIFNIPAIEVGETGSIPVTLSSENVLQSALDAADEITVSYL